MRAPKVALQKLHNLRLRTNNLDDERLKKK
ncbi:MAG: hypothetical protein K0Q63_2381, partial [Paenibacillus sp.]|nr:hypothetical protein [Paenibacillus sp.]